MTVRPRLLAAALGLLAVVPLALTACATTSGAGPSATPGPTTSGLIGDADLEAAWLEDGRAVGIVTYGSSTCLPIAGEPTYENGVLTVEISDVDAQACTRDLVPRGSYVGLPEGVDPTQALEIVVTGTYAGDVDLEGDPALTGVSGEMTEFEPSAGWFDSDGFLLLTYGSSTCVPALESAVAAGASEVTVTFVQPPADQVCTADMAPRITVVGVEDDDALEDDTTITAILSGDGFEAVSVPIAGRP